MTNYEVIETEGLATMVKKTNADGKVLWIPLDPANSDYQRYLRWLENPDSEEGVTL